MKALLRALVVLVVIAAAIGGLAAYSVARRGLSTRTEPSRVEEVLARATRRLATPRELRTTNNPVESTPEVLDAALEHFADHCATCHANDGSGNTTIGRSLYPRAPDMRAAATQSLTDGELYSIIENGIRLTGMPAWGDGTAEGQRASWALVHFIRRLPKLTPEDIERMESLNPKTAAEFHEQEETRRFLAGEDSPADKRKSPPKGHKH